MDFIKRIIYPTHRTPVSNLQENFKDKWVVITGASKGIGFELSETLIAAKANLFLLARSEPELKQLCEKALQNGCKAEYRVIDLRDREALVRLCNDLHNQLPYIDYLFVNAGKSIHRKLINTLDRIHDFDRTMDLNFRALVAMSLALQSNIKSAKGKIVYTSSISTLYPSAPGWAAYHASKEAANVWCRTADVEYSSFGVKVKVAYMPLVHTEMSNVNETYRKMPAFSAKEAAEILIYLSLNNRHSYMPWWARISTPIATLLSPIIRFIFRKFF